jgi:sterol carrier protein 2
MAPKVAQRRVFVVGVGMTEFLKPGAKQEKDYPELAKVAGQRALADACIKYEDVDQVVCSYVYGDSTCGQRAAYELGLTGVPIYNTNNNCASGSTALYMARQFVAGGSSECCLALGFEKMEPGSLGSKFQDRTNPLDKHMEVMVNLHDFTPAPPAAQMFGNAGREHQAKYGSKPEHFAKIAAKNHAHSKLNPYSQFRGLADSVEKVLASPLVHAPLTKAMCCPTSDGAAACLVASEDFVKRHGLEGQAVEIVGMSMKTDTPSVFADNSMMKMVGYDMTRNAAEEAYKQAGIKATDIQVLELHDCFAANELITYEALKLCPEGKAGDFIDQGNNDYGGQVCVNPSGGLISKGHPLGATGLAQCSEMVWQLRGECGPRQVPGVKIAASHNLGLGGAVVLTIYKRPQEWASKKPKRAVSGAMGFQAPAKL